MSNKDTRFLINDNYDDPGNAIGTYKPRNLYRNFIPETEPRGSNSSKASTFWFGGDAELPELEVTWLALLLAGGEEALGAAATEVSPSLSSKKIFSVCNN